MEFMHLQISSRTYCKKMSPTRTDMLFEDHGDQDKNVNCVWESTAHAKGRGLVVILWVFLK